MIKHTLKVIARHNISIEIKKNEDCGGLYSAHEILDRALYYGVDVTFGFDNPYPERVGDEFHLVQQRPKEICFGNWNEQVSEKPVR